MAEPAEQRWTLEEFLARDDGSNRRYQLAGGQIVAMASPKRGARHDRLESHDAHRQPAPATVSRAARVRGRLPGRDDSFYQLDLAVTCAPADPARRYVAEPELIVEVSSPSGALHDRGRKLDHYRQLHSLNEILLVAGEERRVQHWRRDDTRWMDDDLIGDTDLRVAIVTDLISQAANHEGSRV